MGNDAKKTELVPGTLEMLILKTIERNPGPDWGRKAGTTDKLSVDDLC